jgi:hypothetical protein
VRKVLVNPFGVGDRRLKNGSLVSPAAAECVQPCL